MANPDLDSVFKKQPNYLQQDIGQGALKGIVVDVRDPHMERNARVLVYAEHGDYKNLDIYTIDWAKPLQGAPGTDHPPKIGDRVWVTQEVGEKTSFVYFGSWSATPMGDGTLPWNKRKGNDLPFESRHHRDLYPEASTIKRSGNGNCVWIADLFLNKQYLASSINLMDTGGKYFKIKSFHEDLEQEYSPVDEFDEGKGQLYKGDIGEFKPVREGHEFPQDIDPTSGSIEFGIQSLSVKLISGKEDYSAAVVEQKQEKTKTTYDSVILTGKLVRQRLDAVVAGMMDGHMGLFAPDFVRIPKLLTCPKRWDEEQSGGTLA